jgi:hypothetical protein
MMSMICRGAQRRRFHDVRHEPKDESSCKFSCNHGGLQGRYRDTPSGKLCLPLRGSQLRRARCGVTLWTDAGQRTSYGGRCSPSP